MSDVEWPKSISEWRDRSWNPEGSRPYDLWKREPLRDFFRQNGYILWHSEHELGISTGSVELIPPNDAPRRPDGYTFVTRYQCQPGIVIYKANFGQVKNIHCTARTIHNQDVVIRLISIDGDATGDEHYKAIRRLSAGPTAFRGDNHALPLLNELEFNGLRFVVFPLLSIGGPWLPWYYNADEILDYLSQIFQGVKFCHDNLIAHLDLDVTIFFATSKVIGRSLTGLSTFQSLGHSDLISLSDIISTTSKRRFVSIKTRIRQAGKSLAYPMSEWVESDSMVENTRRKRSLTSLIALSRQTCGIWAGCLTLTWTSISKDSWRSTSRPFVKIFRSMKCSASILPGILYRPKRLCRCLMRCVISQLCGVF
ncbi:hypothetical protein ARMSODRAFT_722197 [Armillaria solidipes]|uniref:Protein kinase domain-containing protein n=1 Tax=Armillaria solidipes TaxID=1076256 RepID=A0A2H3B3P7_9AGAR|nr:hypothetical protein ARMSODRAFT_722197 [Armillaria solidipes]